MPCLKPYTTKENIPVPCGKCPSCYNRRASSWAFRLMQEDKYSINAYFLTLTYDNSNVPITPSKLLSLRRKDVQLFIKRLRKLQRNFKGRDGNWSKANIKYYAVGEYGTKYKRPHYHLIIYNVKPELIEKAWSLDGKPIGTIYLGNVSNASVGYALKYMSKESQVPKWQGDDREKEKALMSKGLGLGYLTKNMISWHRSDLLNRRYCNMQTEEGIYKIAMPRYYQNKLYKWYEQNMINEHVINKIKEQDLIKIITGKVPTQKQYLSQVNAAFKKMAYRHKISSNEF